ncbi:TM1266 family iron-only hydrogenase system putative regulator [Desulfolutivibrio sp.]|uniref:TM1266 family iron-only hydrogenase system putative regulator n=1 Tax=Desulfolutivibrio sp. TaxID=2773296 RepID=UPI002F96303A
MNDAANTPGRHPAGAETRMGILALAVKNRSEAAEAVNRLISEYGELVIGRIGVPYRQKGLSVIAMIVEGTTDALGAFSGKLGMLPAVKSKMVLFDSTAPGQTDVQGS